MSVVMGGSILLVAVWGACSGGKNQPTEKKINVSLQKQADSMNQSDRKSSAKDFSKESDGSKKPETPGTYEPQWLLSETENSAGQAITSIEYDDHPLPNLHKPRIVIEKSKLRLTVFDGPRARKRYRAAVGGGKGDKTREGDHCTPVGDFYVCVRNTRSKYVLSLGLSYPNIGDARRGLRAGLINQGQYDRIAYAIRKGRQPPWNTKLGGEIMIHGKREGGRETKGCIALEDDDIRELFPKIPLGTKVTILP